MLKTLEEELGQSHRQNLLLTKENQEKEAKYQEYLFIILLHGANTLSQIIIHVPLSEVGITPLTSNYFTSI